MTKQEFHKHSLDQYDSYEDYILENLKKWGRSLTLEDIQALAKHFKLSGWS